MIDDAHDDNELLLTNEVEEQPEAETLAEDGDDEISIEIEGEEAVEETPAMRELRNRLRDTQKELAERRRSETQKPADIGKEPELEDFDWDEPKFKAEWKAWNERVQAANAARTNEQQQIEVRNREFERAKVNYSARAQTMGIKDFDIAEKAVLDTLGSEILGFIVQYGKDPAKLVGALGRNPAIMTKIDAEPDGIRKLLMLRDLEDKVKVTNRKAPPPPEADTIVRGSASLSAGRDATLEKLEKDADRTGDRTALLKYKRSKGI